MIKRRHAFKNQGTVLILALWALTLLTVFAVSIGVRIQQKMTLLARLERKADAQAMATSAIRLARALFRANFNMTRPIAPALFQELCCNNPEAFANIAFAQGNAEIAYTSNDQTKMYGLVDEERKININKADRDVLIALISAVTHVADADAQTIADGIVDWRQYGESTIGGFYSSDYYGNLEFPYPEKKNNFEVIEELLLVQGVTPAIYDQLKDFVTVYGDGMVNVNTASAITLSALGLESTLVSKIIQLRNGADGQSLTMDDYYFNSPGDIIPQLEANGNKLVAREIQQIQSAISKGYLGSASHYYRATSTARSIDQKTNYVISCVFRSGDGKIISWRED